MKISTKAPRLKRPALPAAWRQQWEAAGAQARAWWTQRAAREKRLSVLCAVICLVAGAWVLGIAPALARIERWEGELPQLAAQSTEIDAIVRDAARHRADAGASSAVVSEQALAQSLDAAGLANSYVLALASEKTEPTEAEKTETEQTEAEKTKAEPSKTAHANARPGDWTIRFTDAPVQALVPWLLDGPHELGLSPRRVTLTRPEIERAKPPGLTVVSRDADEDSSPDAAVRNPEPGRLSGLAILGPRTPPKDKS
ncbi:General secretion pathway%2C M protein [Bordetella ansorpii]|uniref:General secretion pathway, M protein n=1 Tax=Bordetella ansorpii TaxID=288768 RepID=A0A157SRG3_9BORD|nr:type II secretion system protein GspM [Bordetella ansorpii]SAI72985.1 General secretion pathway%2C M protein [Bordetella ansorpii]